MGYDMFSVNTDTALADPDYDIDKIIMRHHAGVNMGLCIDAYIEQQNYHFAPDESLIAPIK
jgi:hypothetical protein